MLRYIFKPIPKDFTLITSDRKKILLDINIKSCSFGYNYFFSKSLYNQSVQVKESSIVKLKPYIEAQILYSQCWFLRLIPFRGSLHQKFEGVYSHNPQNLKELYSMLNASYVLYLSEIQSFLLNKIAEIWFITDYFSIMSKNIPTTGNYSILELYILLSFEKRKKKLEEDLISFLRKLPNAYFRLQFVDEVRSMTIQHCIDELVKLAVERIEL